VLARKLDGGKMWPGSRIRKSIVVKIVAVVDVGVQQVPVFCVGYEVTMGRDGVVNGVDGEEYSDPKAPAETGVGIRIGLFSFRFSNR
jgi:hypothetical protein